MSETASVIITVSAVLGALIFIFGTIFAVYRWYLKQLNQDEEIQALKGEMKSIKEEQCVIVCGLLACLKGLREQGCNGPVTRGIDTLEKHINKRAHDV